VAEDDESSAEPGAVKVEDNSLGRLLTLSDGVFAIAMTLLALDLKVPDGIGGHPSDHALRHALGQNSSSYLSFLLSFYVIGNYWLRHRRLMRSVVAIHPALIRDTLLLLLVVAAMPFPTSLLGTYGSAPFSLSLYGAFNVVAILILMSLSRNVRRLDLVDHNVVADDYERRWQSWLSLVVFLLCIPAGYVVGSKGPYVLILLAIPARVSWIQKRFRRRTTAA
jgi:uncharacterized membrane protein